ncbi:MAG: hypothetical protein IPJ88_06495 [Myxococcales bacterium]|nr:MAG: hypothetical protein IPJ88_06495 [Myxococcales bacterium]
MLLFSTKITFFPAKLRAGLVALLSVVVGCSVAASDGTGSDDESALFCNSFEIKGSTCPSEDAEVRTLYPIVLVPGAGTVADDLAGIAKQFGASCEPCEKYLSGPQKEDALSLLSVCTSRIDPLGGICCDGSSDAPEIYIPNTPRYVPVDETGVCLKAQVDVARRIFVSPYNDHTGPDGEPDGFADKVHGIGHSQGGLDLRDLAATEAGGDLLISVTTLASPHQGTSLAQAPTLIVDGVVDKVSCGGDGICTVEILPAVGGATFPFDIDFAGTGFIPDPDRLDEVEAWIKARVETLMLLAGDVHGEEPSIEQVREWLQSILSPPPAEVNPNVFYQSIGTVSAPSDSFLTGIEIRGSKLTNGDLSLFNYEREAGTLPAELLNSSGNPKWNAFVKFPEAYLTGYVDEVEAICEGSYVWLPDDLSSISESNDWLRWLPRSRWELDVLWAMGHTPVLSFLMDEKVPNDGLVPLKSAAYGEAFGVRFGEDSAFIEQAAPGQWNKRCALGGDHGDIVGREGALFETIESKLVQLLGGSWGLLFEEFKAFFDNAGDNIKGLLCGEVSIPCLYRSMFHELVLLESKVDSNGDFLMTQSP